MKGFAEKYLRVRVLVVGQDDKIFHRLALLQEKIQISGRFLALVFH